MDKANSKKRRKYRRERKESEGTPSKRSKKNKLTGKSVQQQQQTVGPSPNKSGIHFHQSQTQRQQFMVSSVPTSPSEVHTLRYCFLCPSVLMLICLQSTPRSKSKRKTSPNNESTNDSDSDSGSERGDGEDSESADDVHESEADKPEDTGIGKAAAFLKVRMFLNFDWVDC